MYCGHSYVTCLCWKYVTSPFVKINKITNIKKLGIKNLNETILTARNPLSLLCNLFSCQLTEKYDAT